jgi:DNA ligase-1
MKPIPNKAIQSYLGKMARLLEGMDGELIIGSHDKEVYRRTVSAVMSHEGNPVVDLTWFVFDVVGGSDRYQDRLAAVHTTLQGAIRFTGVKPLNHTLVADPETVLNLHQSAVQAGFEGLVLRNPTGLYKTGRSTLREQGMVKVKMFEDSEAEVLGVVELLHNMNAPKVSEIGSMKRSSHQANKVSSGMMGALSVRDLKTGVEFEIGTGFTEHMRRDMWECPPVGKLVKYKYFPAGSKDKPRFPVFLGLRDWNDV